MSYEEQERYNIRNIDIDQMHQLNPWQVRIIYQYELVMH